MRPTEASEFEALTSPHGVVGGTPSAAPWQELYDELRRIAGNLLARERPDHTLQPTALVNEAYLRLAGQDGLTSDRLVFFAAAANTLRRVLVDYARTKKRRKRGGPDARRLTLDTSLLIANERPVELLELDDALNRLGEVEPRLARLVELRFFAGLTEAEAAAALEVSRRTVQLDWRAAQAWLRRELAP